MGVSFRATQCIRNAEDKSEETWAALPRVVTMLAPAVNRVLEQSLGQSVRFTSFDTAQALAEPNIADVALLHVDKLDPAYSPLFKDARFGFPELVFVVDEAWSPQHFALRSRGFQHVVSQDELLEWLSRSVARLGTLAQARRIVLGAYADTPIGPELAQKGRQARQLKLHAAETTFRDSYLRSLLAEHGSRRKAAEEAGVPYRSFCEMLRKLDI